jgi:hypothetical protein
MNLPEILNKLMAESDIDSVQLSKYTDIPVATISRIRTNDKANPTTATLKPIAQFFNISIDQLLGIQELPSNRIPGTFNSVHYTSSLVPIIEWDNVLDFLTKKQEFFKGKFLQWISSERNLPDNAFALIIRNENPVLFLKNGAIILVAPQNRVQSGNIAIFSTNEKKRIELYQVILDGDEVYIKSTNPEIKDIKRLPKTFTFIGSIVEIRYTLQKDTTTESSAAKNILAYNVKNKIIAHEA